MQGGTDDPIGAGLTSPPDDPRPAAEGFPSVDPPPEPPVSAPDRAADPEDDDDATIDHPVSTADDAVSPPPPPPPPPPEPDPPVPFDPMLPRADAKPSAAVIATPVAPTRGAETWYRTDQDRFRSVHRRANPWYRRLARGIIGLSFLAAAGIGLFYGARVIQDFLDRDRLPGQGVDVPEIRATSFELRSTAPAPMLDGTLTMDVTTKAFEFIGRGTGQQAGIQVVSPDGSRVFVRRGVEAWETPDAGDAVVTDVLRATAYLADDDSADDILTNQLRRGYVDLIKRTELGDGDDEVRRYEMRLDTASLEADFPIQYQGFKDRAIPGVQSVRGLLVTIALDSENVLVEVDDMNTNWSWQRLTYSNLPFTPIDPAEDLLGNTIEITDGTIGDG